MIHSELFQPLDKLNKEPLQKLLQPIYELVLPVVKFWSGITDQALINGAGWLDRAKNFLGETNAVVLLPLVIGAGLAGLPRHANMAYTFLAIETGVAAISHYSQNTELMIASGAAFVGTLATRLLRGNNDYELPENQNKSRRFKN